MTIRIYNFARGGRGLRVLWLCEEMGLSYETVFIPFPQPPEYRARHSLGNVPFLEDEGGVAIHESVAILLYLAERHGPTPLLPGRDDPALARVLELTVFAEATIGAGLNALLTARFGAPEGDRRNWSVRMHEGAVARAIGFVDERLGAREFLVGDRLTLADLAITTTLGIWKGALDGALPERLVAYRERMAARPAYQRALARNG